MSRTIRVCSYLVLPLLYLLVNVKLAQLGESFPVTVVTFLPLLLLLFVDRINIKKLLIALGVGGGWRCLTTCLANRWMPASM